MSPVQLPAIHPDKEVPEVVIFARNLADQIRKRDANLEVYLTGVVFMNNAFSENSINDMKTLVPAMFLIIVVLLVLMLRSFWANTDDSGRYHAVNNYRNGYSWLDWYHHNTTTGQCAHDDYDTGRC